MYYICGRAHRDFFFDGPHRQGSKPKYCAEYGIAHDGGILSWRWRKTPAAVSDCDSSAVVMLVGVWRLRAQFWARAAQFEPRRLRRTLSPELRSKIPRALQAEVPPEKS